MLDEMQNVCNRDVKSEKPTGFLIIMDGPIVFCSSIDHTQSCFHCSEHSVISYSQ